MMAVLFFLETSVSKLKQYKSILGLGAWEISALSLVIRFAQRERVLILIAVECKSSI